MRRAKTLLGVVVPAVLGGACYQSHERSDAALIEERIRDECGARCQGTIVQIEAGGLQTCALYDGGGVVCWGLVRGVADDPALGVPGGPGSGWGGSEVATPRAVSALPPVEEVSSGGLRTCARTPEGRVLCWGHNDDGQVGDGTRTRRLLPVDTMQPTDVSSMWTGVDTACVVLDDGRMRRWGYASLPEQTVPTLVEGISDARACVQGSRHFCALHADGHVSCRGFNDKGQLGDPAVGESSRTLVPVPGVTDVVRLAASHDFTLAVRDDGSVLWWGTSWDEHAPSPQPVEGLDEVVEVDTTGQRSCAVRSDGRVLCWGKDEGLLGHPPLGGDEVVRAPPVVVDAVEDVVDVAIAGRHGCVLDAYGAVACWGRNAWGAAGFSRTSDLSHVPLPVIGLPGADG